MTRDPGSPMRIVSLLPSLTELVHALGRGGDLVGVTHECDHPTGALDKPHVTKDKLPPGLSAAEIDAAVRASTEAGESIYELDVAKLRELKPDLIVTQELCMVCAVSYDDVCKIVADLDPQPKVVSLDPKTFGETIGDIRTLSDATGAKEAAFVLLATIAKRVERVKKAVEGAPLVPVAAIEWLDPVFIAGHWTPQLIEMAGGFDVLGLPGEHSEESTLAFFATDPEFFCQRLDALVQLRGRAQVEAWQAQVRAGEVEAVVRELLARHYDPGYAAPTTRNFPAFATAPVIAPADRSAEAMAALARQLVAG